MMRSQWASDAHCDITMDSDITRDMHCDGTMSNGVAMFTYHAITIPNDGDEAILLCILYYLCCFIMGSME